MTLTFNGANQAFVPLMIVGLTSVLVLQRIVINSDVVFERAGYP